jgi:4-aminobutyrate aminotransferase-like enzyme
VVRQIGLPPGYLKDACRAIRKAGGVGLTVLDVIADEGLQQHAHEVSCHFLAQLRQLAEWREAIGDVRSRGFFYGPELVTDRQTREPAMALAGWVIERMKNRSFLPSTDSPFDRVLEIRPTLPLDRERVGEYIAALVESLSAS